jgi:hypothetical protein
LSSTSDTSVNKSWGRALSRARLTELLDSALGRPLSRTSLRILDNPDWDTCDPPCEEESTLLDDIGGWGGELFVSPARELRAQKRPAALRMARNTKSNNWKLEAEFGLFTQPVQMFYFLRSCEACALYKWCSESFMPHAWKGFSCIVTRLMHMIQHTSFQQKSLTPQ